jgi:hypothetical protein
MPWCEECSKYWTPTGLAVDGKCPNCGSDLDAPQQRAAAELEQDRAPWHFKLLVVALVVYLGWRLIDLFI